MGTFRVPFELGDPAGERWVTVEGLVDAGSTYTWVPRDVLAALGIRPIERFPFLLADGRAIERDIAETRVRLNGRVRTTLVVFGDEGSMALLGVVTLEQFGLGVDPVKRVLTPVPGLALRAAAYGGTTSRDGER
ncbi:MAG: hypothetical protein HYU88_02435 [Chloroflexi bacterium]|nr:hypothetical protein [Chloroflexota bacterium]